MKAWGRTMCIGVAVAALLGLAAPVSAFEIPASGPVAALTVTGSHHFGVSFYVSPGASGIAVSNREGGLVRSETEYFRFQGEVTEGRIGADFGHRGRFEARFRPNGKLRKRKLHGCVGGPQVTRFGVFEGTIRFSGEHGYTDFEAPRVSGSMSSRPRQICHRHHSKRRSHPPRHQHHPARQTITIFRVESTDGLKLEALQSSQDPKTNLFFATDSDVSEGNLILRRAITIGHLGSFAFDAKLNSATIEPPAPFSGSATFQRLDDYTTRWEGPLTVSFPGLPDAPLTGRDFSWSLTSDAVSGGGLVSFHGPPQLDPLRLLKTYRMATLE
ncbi:MAG TPA: hypothetical protein VGO24_00430 [Solirubrobacterales bacterium]|nr:hypothetical protein [Solirubrobacterales bacterium]